MGAASGASPRNERATGTTTRPVGRDGDGRGDDRRRARVQPRCRHRGRPGARKHSMAANLLGTVTMNIAQSSPPQATRFIFVTGGVVSSLGKGIAAASLGRLLVERG